MHNINHQNVRNGSKLVQDGPPFYAARTWLPVFGRPKLCVCSWWIWWIYNKLFVPSRVSNWLEIAYSLEFSYYEFLHFCADVY